MTEKKEKVLVAMSGGVDSSVVAALLVEQGYDVTGAYMINYDEQRTTTNDQRQSCWHDDYQDALRVAAKLGISLLKLNFVEEYKKLVLDYTFKEYEKGRTPNPDVMCNRHIKFGVWLDKVKELGFDKLATGHYTHLNEQPSTNNEQGKKKKVVGRWSLMVAKDKNKDQTYFLHQLNQEQLSHTLFPLGEYNKKEVRELAKKFDLPTAQKEESMGICFVGEVSIEEFLKDKIKSKAGNIITSDGEVVGKHTGLAFYTIGQRHGFEQAGGGEPLFVVDKRFDSNELVVGLKNDPLLYKDRIQVENLHWIAGREPDFPLKCKVRMRHRQTLQRSTINDQGTNVFIEFEESQRAVTPGQFAVFYLDDECLGGGVIL